MLIAAILCALLGIGLLVAATVSPSDGYTYALFVVVTLGIVFFAIDHWRKRR